MMDFNKLNQMLSQNEVNESTGFKDVMKQIMLSDGGHLSVQTGLTHYCHPRDNYGPWSHVEVGFPSFDPGNDWKEYFDGDWDTTDHTESVYGYVPIELVVECINNHGGIKGD